MWSSIYPVIFILTLQLSSSYGQDLVLSCPNDWTLLFANCYVVVPDHPLPWTEALATCEMYGGRLVEPIGFDVTKEIGNTVLNESPTTKRIWTGYNRRGLSSTSDVNGYWSDGRETTVDVGVWGANEPEVTVGDCAYLQLTDGSWRMYMGVCDTLMAFMCQALPCPAGTFRCDSGKCIGNDNKCNRENNCGDFSDERACEASCSYYLTGREGEVTFPEDNEDYSEKTTCQWVIEGAVGSRIQVSFLRMETEKGLDFVEIWVGGRTISTSTFLYRLSGTSAEDSKYIVSPNNFVIVRFVSDFSYQYGGFQFEWRSEFKCSLLSLPATRQGENTVVNSRIVSTSVDTCEDECLNRAACIAFSYLKVERDCVLFTTMPDPVSDSCCDLYVKTCPGEQGTKTLPSIPNLGGTLYATVSPQRLYSPLYPVYYLSGATVAWTIIATSKRVVSLEILDVDLPTNDKVTVYDGDGPSSPIMGTVTQGSVNYNFISTGTALYVLFKSSQIDPTKRGFLFSYQSGCDVTLSTLSGTISSPGYATGQYPSILSCSWKLITDTPLKLTFNSNFGLENNKDFLQIFNGDSEFGTPKHLGSGFTGSSPPTGPLTSVNGRLFLRLTTSATGTDVGFSAVFKAGCPAITDNTLVIQPSDYTRYHGDLVTISCREGYIFSSPSLLALNSVQMSCKEGAQWSITPVPTCSRVFCGTPPTVANGYLVSVEGLYGDQRATYSCDSGYTTVKSSIMCLSSGSWEQRPICTATSCPPLPSVRQGTISYPKGNGQQHGTIAKVTCIAGYDIIGVDTLTCNQGVWSADTPTCSRVECGLPYVAHGRLSPGQNVFVNDIVTVICDSGFRLNGSQNTFQCGLTIPPTCVNIDECAESRSGCTQVCTDTDGGYICSCNPGYTLASVGSAVCYDINECNTNNGGCDVGCDNQPGSYRCTCPAGYELFASNGQGGILIPQGETGNKPWNLYHLNHTCIKTRCSTPSLSINNGRALTSQTTFYVGDSITYLCNIGYVIQGQTTLTCYGSNTWSAPVPACVAATCPPLTAPSGSVNAPSISPQTAIAYGAHFTLTCGSTTQERPCIYDRQTDSYRVSSTELQCSSLDCGEPTRYSGTTQYITSCTTSGCQFLFECKLPTFTRQGTSSQSDSYVRCGVDGHWDFGDLRCIGPTCPDPGTPPGGQQQAMSYEEFSLVYYQCDRVGFLPTNPYPLLCEYQFSTLSLAWNGTMPQCTDQTAPSYNNCPSDNQNVNRFNTLPGTEPQPNDNSNLLYSKSVNPENFQIGVTKIAQDIVVTYQATDYAGNVGTCRINVFVVDEEPPVLTCQNSFVYRLSSEFDQRTYDTRTFASATDNSNSVNLDFSVTELRLDITNFGSVHTVFITATDPSGNEDTCIVQVSVEGPICQPWTVVVENGQSNCINAINGYRCTITCDIGYTLFENAGASSTDVSCTSITGWGQLPSCVPVRPLPYRVAPTLRYVIGTSNTAECEATYQTQLTSQLSAVLPSLSALCSNLPGSLSLTVTIPTNQNAVIISSFSGVVNARFNLELTPQGLDVSQYSQCSSNILNAFSSISTSIGGLRQLSTVGTCAASQTATYSNTAAEGLGCYEMEEVRNDGSTSTCVTCAAGYYLGGGSCVQCNPGYYRDRTLSSCLPCPGDSQNTNQGITSKAECYRVCPRGSSSASGQAPCSMCPADTYGSNPTTCQQCPSGQSTYRSGQTTSTACKNPCGAGYYSSTGLAPCTPCPISYYQPSSRATTCIECPTDKYTQQEASASSNQCISPDAYLCGSGRCLNGGTCTIVDHDFFCLCPPDYTGRNCVTKLLACTSTPCFNRAFCIDHSILNYTCYCPSSRYSGRHCEIDKNDCDVNPCQNYGSCQDKFGAYSCLCPSFSEYTGFSCTTPRNPCNDTPCYGNAQCMASGSVRRKCVCPSGYTGADCNLDIDECLSTPCLNGGTCRNNVNSFSCDCPMEYTGTLCETRKNICTLSAACGTSATCIDNYKENKAACFCSPGYEDVSGTCQLLNPCGSSPCDNGGVCRLQGSSYTCNCANGYEGFNCQHEVNECELNPCQNGATCVDKINDYECICVTRFPNLRDTSDETQFGKNCQDWQNDCQTPSYPCDLAGTVSCDDLYEDYECTCKDGYYGKNCTKGDTDCASLPCRHGGTCQDLSSSTYKCTCTNGYTGVNCESKIDHCANSPCTAGSTCISTTTGYVCNCPPRFTGTTCSSVYDVCDIAQPCVGPGSNCTYNGYTVTCGCRTGYGGNNCETKTIECTSSTCLYGGACSDVNGIISCLCQDGTTGDRCEVNINECDSNPCPSGAQCVDLINSYTCVCQSDKIGETCQKELSHDFDVVLRGMSSYPVDSAFTPQQLGSQAVTLSVWVRYTKTSTPGIIATLYGVSSGTVDSSAQELLRLENGRARIMFPGSANQGAETGFSFITDSSWHLVSVVWQADNRQLSVYIDGVFIAVETYTQATSIPYKVWLVVGGTYDASKEVIDQSQGMEGRISRLSITPRALSLSDINKMYNEIDEIPTDAVLGFTTDIVAGRNGLLDYKSQLSQGVCVSQTDCRSLSEVTSAPSITTCPDDQLQVSPRVSTPIWTEPEFSGETSIRTNYVSGGTDMGWNTYGIAYAGSDNDGNAAICTFRFYNRRSACSVPEQPLLGQSICTVIDGGYRCSVQCNSNNFAVAQPIPKYYSCGTYGMYNQADSPLPFEFPACSNCVTPKLDLTLTLDFIMNNLCTSSLQASLVDQVRSVLTNINSQWQQGLCNAASCGGIGVTTLCGPDTRTMMVTILLKSVKDGLTNSASQSKSPSEIMAVAVVDDQSFRFTIGAPDISSYIMASVRACDDGRQLIGDCCAECAQGTYFSTSGGTCVECEVGKYLADVGQIESGSDSPCQSCTGGKTTPNTGAQSEDECRDSCEEGEFYNLTLGRCQTCAVGFYSSSEGSFFCQPCIITLTTESTGSTDVAQCSIPYTRTTTDNFLSTTTATAQTPGVGASTAGTDDWILIVIIIIVVLLVILLIIIIICCCCRGALEKCCPCLITKVVPEGVSKWHYVDRFGETNMKFVSYKMGDYRAQKNDKQALVSETGSEDGSVATNISVHVPVFEEKLNGTITKKPLLITGSAPEETKEKRPKVKKVKDEDPSSSNPKSLPPLPDRLRAGGSKAPSTYGSIVKRPPSAFNKKRPTLADVPPEEFVNKIDIDDDDDGDYR